MGPYYRELVVWQKAMEAARERVKRDTVAAGLPDDGEPLAAGGVNATAYSDAVAMYLGLATARYSNASSTLCSWNPGEKKEDIRFTFSRQALALPSQK